MKKLLLSFIAILASTGLWAGTVAQWTFDKAYNVNEGIYTPNEDASEDVTGWFNAITPHILPNTYVGTQTDYDLTAMSTGRYWQFCIGYNNRVLRIENVDANAITNFTDATQHNVYYEVSFPTLNYQNIVVTYHLAYGGNAEVPIHMVYSTNNGTTWTEAGTNNTASGWWTYNESTQSLNATHKANVIVRLIADNGYASNWNLLDVTVTGEAYEAPAEGQPVTFGIGRTIETAATATTPNILAAGQEVVKGTIPTDFVVTNTTTCDYANSNATLYRGATDMENSFTAPNAWKNLINNVAVNDTFNNDFYCGFKVVVPTGKVLNVSQIFGDFIAQKNNTNFKFQVYKSGVKVYESPERGKKNAQNGGAAAYPMTVNTSETAALQNMGGTIEFRMPWNIASTSASGAVLDFNITATVADKSLDNYNVTYSLGETTVTAGSVPQAETVTEGNSLVIPANTFLYKEGYTLTGWSDGTHTYAAGETFTPTADATLTAVFTANTKSVATMEKAAIIKWPFALKDGCQEISIEGAGKVAYIIRQATVDGEMQDLALKVDASAGKFNNAGRADDWAQVNGGTVISFPSNARATITSKVYQDPTSASTLDGAAYTSYTGGIATWTANPTEGISTLNIAAGSYYSYIELSIPKAGTAWDNYTDFALDLTNGAYIHETETNVITIGFKQDGDNIVRCAADDADAIGTVAGKFHSKDHGLQNFSMTVAVPGYVKIEAGTCAWGGNLTISGTNGFTTTVNTNNGTCFHQDKAKNKVVAYYTVNEGTTLTISGGNYMPYIAVTQVNEVPTAHTVTFKNGENVVSTKSVYEGTAIGTLPTVTTGANEYFLGWYSDANDITKKISTATIINTDITYYANIVPLYTNAEGQLTPQAGNTKSFLAHLGKANEQGGVIYLANGTYDLASLINTEVKNNVVILGESREGVIIVNHPAQAGMSSSETLNLTGNNIYMQHLTVRCDVSYPGSVADGVGTAIRTYGDKNIFYDIDMQGNQDTYNTPMKVNARAYVKACRIEGTVDYICGSGNVWFEAVDLYMNARSNADVIVAPSTSADTEYGYVFNGCTIRGDAAQAGRYNLARGWQGSPAATWINTTCLIAPSAKGYVFMHDPLTVRFHEYNTMDKDGNAITGHNLTGLGYDAASDAIYLNGIGDYTYANVVMGADGWDPESIILYYNRVHVRDIAAGEYGTICLPYNATATGAVIMSVIGRNEDGTGIVCEYVGDTEAESTALEAGQAYIYRATAGEQTFAITAENANDYVQPAQTDCMVGTFSALTLESGKYFLYPVDQMFHPAGDNVLIPAYRCYLNTNNVMNMPQAEVEAPTRTVVFGIQRPVMTGVDNTTDHRASKVLVDGHLYILHGGKVINL